jgi:uncharacterized protein (DUF2164 family)
MPIELTKEERAEVLPSIRRFFRDELEVELSELQSTMILKFILVEVAPFAYNNGVKDAETYFRGRIEDLSGACFEPSLTYWNKKAR